MKNTMWCRLMALTLAFMLTITMSDVKVSAEGTEVEATAKAYECEAFSEYLDQLNVGNVDVASININEPAQDEELDKKHVMSFTMPEDGYAFFNFYGKNHTEYNFKGDCNVYSDIRMTNKVFDFFYNSMMDTTKEFCNLKAGTYYVEIVTDRLFSHHDMNHEVGFSVGYIKAGTKMVKLTPSTTKATNKDVKVKITVNKDITEVWAEHREPVLLGNQSHWSSDKLVEGDTFTAKENGDYTVQVKDCYGNYYQEYIQIKNIDRKKPSTPSLTYYKSGKTYVKGKAEKKNLVYVKIGSKYYKAYASSYGNFTIKTPKLKKNATIYVCCKDAATNKSSWKKYKVK